MNCQALEPLIALYVEGDLPERDTPLVEGHVAACADCRELLEDLRASQAVVKEVGAEAVDAALLTAIRSGVLAGIDRRGTVIWPWVAAAAAALAILALFQAPPRRPAPEPRPVAIAPALPKVQAAVGGQVLPARGRRPRRPATAKGPVQQQLVVKMLTDDPDIVIIWLVDQTGD